MKRNTIYVVRVRPEGLMESFNHKNVEEYTSVKEFYTGDGKMF